VAEQAGRLDISFNLVSYGDVQQPLTEKALDRELGRRLPAADPQRDADALPDHQGGRAAHGQARIGGDPGVRRLGPATLPGLGGFKIALDTLEGHRRQWACELGSQGVRVVTLTAGGVPESLPDTFAARDAITAELDKATLPGRTATLADVGNVAAFVASDQARTLTSTAVNISCGAIVD
jgi:3-oxoacyl-[acyl-carrier protein] reductase